MTDVEGNVKRIEDAPSEEEALKIESELLEQSDNRPQDGDPLQPEEAE